FCLLPFAFCLSTFPRLPKMLAFTILILPMQRFTFSKTAQAKRRQVHSGALPLRNQLGQTLTNGWRFLKARAGQATGQVESLGSSLPQNRLPIRSHIIDAAPPPTGYGALECWRAMTHFPACKPRKVQVNRFIVGVRINSFFSSSGADHGRERVFRFKVHADANVRDDTVAAQYLTRLTKQSDLVAFDHNRNSQPNQTAKIRRPTAGGINHNG